jgi:fibronectin-binding autotransporter adhesin
VASLNYAGKFDATFTSEGGAAHSHAYVHVDSSQTHAPADAVIVPDADLLFHADYTRSGTDLVLTRDDHSFVLHDYFKGEKRAPIASRDGAHLTSDIVKALVGEVHVAQAGNNPAASQVIGHVTKLQGGATVIRNGVSIILNMGDNVEKGDVVQSGASSTVGITFIDGTVFGLSSNARMVLNEMVYDPNGSSNSSLLSLVAGTITFVAGETAKHGDMKIDTPVATMGIRGTAVLVEIDFSVPGQNGAPNASFQVLVEPDGTTGSYILFDKTTLQPIAIVNQAGQQLNINNGIISQTTTPLSPELQKLITDVFQQKFSDNSNSNTKTTTAFTDSIVPISNGLVFKLADGTTATALTLNSLGSLPTGQGVQGNGLNHVSGTLTLQSLGLSGTVQNGFLTAELAGKTGDVFDFASVGGTFHFQDINVGDRPSVTADFTSVAYTNAFGTFTVANGQTSAPGLSALQFTDIATTAIKLFLVPGANNTNNGDVTWVYALRDNAFDFLAAGETLTFTYHITVNSNYLPAPEIQGVDVTITITGSNDKPVITTATQEIHFAAGTTTHGGDLPTTEGSGPTSGTLAFTDVDLTDKHTVSAKLTSAVLSNGGTIPPLPEQLFENALTALLGTDSTGTGNGVINWSFADLPVYVADFIPKDQSVTLTYTVTVTDAQGATSERTITVVIGGTDPAAEVWIHTTEDGHDNLWTTGLNWETGRAPVADDDVIIITDQLHPHTPAYPVLIDEGTHAVAHSVTMNDFQENSEDSAHVPPELDVACDASLTIGAGGLSVAADAIVKNHGTVTVGGAAEFINDSVLKNYGLLTLQQGGDFKDFASISNYAYGTIEVAGGTLNVEVDVANYGHIAVDAGATMTVNAATIHGGTVTVTGAPAVVPGDGEDNAVIPASDGALNLKGASSLEDGTLDNTGQVNVIGTVSFDNEMVHNLGGTITIAGTLTLDGTTIHDGDLVNSGLLQVESVYGATLDGVAVDNTDGTIAVDSETSPDLVTLTLDDGTVITNGDLSIGSIGVLEVSSVAGATLDGVSVDNAGLVQIDGGSTLLLDDGTTITGGNLTNAGTLQVESVDGATLDDVSVDNSGGTIAVDGETSADSVTLYLSDGTTVAHGDLSIGSVGILDVSSDAGAALDDVYVNNSGTIQVEQDSTLLLEDGTTISGGDLVNSGTVQVETVEGAILDGVSVDNDGGTIAVDDETSLETVTLLLEDGTTVTDGDLVIGSVGILEVSTEEGATLDGVNVDNHGVVQIDGDSTLTLTSTTVTSGKVKNNGETDLSGAAVLKNGKLNNYGKINVSGLGNIFDGENVTNNLILISIAGELILESNTSIYGGTLANAGLLHIEASGATLDGVTVDNTDGTIQVDDDGPPTLPPVTLTLDNGMHVTGGHLSVGSIGKLEISTSGATLSGVIVDVNAAGVVQVDSGSTLTLADTTVSGGTINDGGTIDVTHNSTIGGGATLDTTLNNGAVTVEAAAKLTLDNVTVSGTSITDGGSIELDHTVKLTGGATIQGPSGGGQGAVTNLGTLEVAGPATLHDIALTNTGHGVQVDSGQTLHFEHSSITGGTLTVYGTLDSTGDSVISAAITNNNIIEVENGTLTLSGAVSGTGSVVIDHDAILAISGTDDQTIQFSGNNAELKILTASLSATLEGFTTTDKIDLSSIHYDIATTTATYNAQTGVLEITDSDGHVIDLNIGSGYADAHFAGSSDGHDGTLITLNLNDDAPVIASADKAETATVTEASLITGSHLSNPIPPASGTIHFTDVDLTDRPTATIDSQTVTWTDAHGNSMSLNSTQIAELEQALHISQSGHNSGTIDWTYSITDSDLDFLGQDQTLTITSNVKLDDHYANGTDTAKVTVTIHGSDDVPSIVSEANPVKQTVILSETPIVLAPGVTTNALHLANESFNDIEPGSASNNGRGHGTFYSDDLDAHFVASGNAGVVHGSASGVTAAPFFGPNAGQVDTTNYLSIGGGASETITFNHNQNTFGLYWGSVDPGNSISFYEGTKLVATYSGDDIAPLLANGGQTSSSSNGYVEFKDLAPFNKVVLASTANAFEVDNISAGNIQDHHIQLASPVSGTLTVTDADVGDTLTATVAANGVATYNGSINLPAGLNLSSLIDSHAITFDSVTSHGGQEVLHWSYNPANPDFDFLEPGDTLTLTFNAQVTDGHVTTGNQPLTISIVGTGASTVQGTSGNDVFVNVGGGVKISGGDGHDTFQFKPGFGSATISDFDPANDVINIDHTLFANVQAILDSAQSANAGHDTVITDAAHDQITLTNVTVAHLKAAHSGDFHLV